MAASEKCACVVLNYNDSATTCDLVHRIRNYHYIGDIIIVDNCSSDNSLSKLKKLENPQIHLLPLPKNGGYGAGNNAGINYAFKILGYRYVMVSNPDVYFSDEVVGIMLGTFHRYPEYAIVAPVQLDMSNKIIRDFAWKLPSKKEYIFISGLLLWKLLRGCHYSRKLLEGNSIVDVDCVPGALLCLDCKKFKNQYYDEGFFLYCEEMVIGSVVKTNGYKTALLTGERYQHQHSCSINKSISSIRKQRKILTQSRMKFLKKYLHANKIEMVIGYLMFAISDAEAVLNEQRKKRLRGEA